MSPPLRGVFHAQSYFMHGLILRCVWTLRVARIFTEIITAVPQSHTKWARQFRFEKRMCIADLRDFLPIPQYFPWESTQRAVFKRSWCMRINGWEGSSLKYLQTKITQITVYYLCLYNTWRTCFVVTRCHSAVQLNCSWFVLIAKCCRGVSFSGSPPK